MSKKNDFQPVTLKPLLGVLDVRSNIDEMPAGAMRWKLNFGINPDNKLSRALGWTRPFAIEGICPVRNYDFHDQSVPAASREPITLLFQSTANDGTRRLFLGTKTRFALMDEASGAWADLATGLGADGDYSLTQLRFHAAELQNKVFVTNNYDLPMFYDLAGGVLQNIAELTNVAEAPSVGALTKARVIVSWNGVILLMNVTEAGVEYKSRIRWSDLNDGTAWSVATASSITDFQDLDYGEEILGAIPLAGSLLVFTDKSIWRCTFTIDSTVGAESATLNCVKIYSEPKNRAKCLAYPNAIVSTGFEIYYLGSDGVYKYDPYAPQPERVEWIHRATGIIYKELGPIVGLDGVAWSTRIDKGACQSPIMEYVPGPNDDETAGSGELHISWPTYDPLAIPVGGGGTGELDCNEVIPTPPPVGSGINRHTLVLNLKNSTADYRDYGSTAYVNFTSQLTSGDCAQQAMFLAANGTDLTIKQMNIGQYRVQYDAEAETYSNVGYYSILRFVFPFERFDTEKIINNFLVGIIPDDPNETAVLRLRLGTSFEALDPNPKPGTGNCSVLFHQLSNKPFRCRNTRTAAKYVTDGVRPYDPVEWNFYYQGNFLYCELKIAKPDGSAPVSGGCQLSRFETWVKLA